MTSLSTPKTFAIYCSDGASRVIRFYRFRKNLIDYPPSRIIYDGTRSDVIDELNHLFPNRVDVFDLTILSSEEQRKVHTATSRYIHTILDLHNIDYLLCFGNKILKSELIQAYPQKLINFHPAILPSFKGLKAIDQALESGVSFLGNTAHFMDEGIDTGKVIIQTAMLASHFESYEDVLELQFPMMKVIFRDLFAYHVSKEDVTMELQGRTKPFLMPPSIDIH